MPQTAEERRASNRISRAKNYRKNREAQQRWQREYYREEEGTTPGVHTERKRVRRLAQRYLLDMQAGPACLDCGGRGEDFHHRDASTKLFTIGDKIGSVAFPRLLEEAKKCDLLCKRCHRLRHNS